MTSRQHCKQVRFETTISVVRVPGLSEYTREEWDATWFAKEDYSFHRFRDMKIAQRCSSGDYDLEKLQAHGIETESERMRRKQRVRLATLSVFLEQEDQWRRGVQYPDPEPIARIYAKFAKESRYQALRAGLWRYLHTEQQMPSTYSISKRTVPSSTRRRHSPPAGLPSPPRET